MSSARRRFWLWIAALLLTALAVAVRYGTVCRLEAVTVDGESIEGSPLASVLQSGRPLLDQPVDSLTAELLADPAVLKVDVEYVLPDRIAVRTNDFPVAAFVLADTGGRLRMLTAEGYVLPLPADCDDWEHPLITGVSSVPLYRRCEDGRIIRLLRRLEELRESNPDLYRLVAQVDIDASDAVRVTLAGLPYTVTMLPDDLAVRLPEFVRFVEDFPEETADARAFDLRWADLLIKKGARKTHGR